MPSEAFASRIDAAHMTSHYTKSVKLYIVGDQESRLLQTESGKRFLCNNRWKMDKDNQLWKDFCNQGNELYVQALSKTLVLWSIRNEDRRLEFDLVPEGDWIDFLTVSCVNASGAMALDGRDFSCPCDFGLKKNSRLWGFRRRPGGWRAWDDQNQTFGSDPLPVRSCRSCCLKLWVVLTVTLQPLLN